MDADFGDIEMRRPPIAIDFLPWADIKEELTIGPVSFWPYFREASSKIGNSKIRDELNRFLETFVDHAGKQVDTVTAVTCGPIEFREFGESEADSIVAAVDCLVFAAISTGTKNGVCADNQTMGPPSADRFDLAGRWVVPTEYGLLIRTEESTHVWSHGRYKIPQPISLGGIWERRHSNRMLRWIGGIFRDNFPEDVRRRLLRALEWFRLAHTHSTAVTALQKVVMMTTAFEILLEFPQPSKRRHFVEQIDHKLRLDDSLLVNLHDAKGKEIRDGSGKPIKGCKAAEWTGQFYDLRSCIVHGDEVDRTALRYNTTTRTWITHLIVADLVLLEIVKRLLHEHGCTPDVREAAERWADVVTSTIEEVESAIMPWASGLGLESVHEALGWILSLEERAKNADLKSQAAARSQAPVTQSPWTHKLFNFTRPMT